MIIRHDVESVPEIFQGIRRLLRLYGVTRIANTSSTGNITCFGLHRQSLHKCRRARTWVDRSASERHDYLGYGFSFHLSFCLQKRLFHPHILYTSISSKPQVLRASSHMTGHYTLQSCYFCSAEPL
jgi:hypothetical protein